MVDEFWEDGAASNAKSPFFTLPRQLFFKQKEQPMKFNHHTYSMVVAYFVIFMVRADSIENGPRHTPKSSMRQDNMPYSTMVFIC